MKKLTIRFGNISKILGIDEKILKIIQTKEKHYSIINNKFKIH